MDDEPSPSGDSDSVATDQPLEGTHEFQDAPVIAELDMDRQLDPHVKWVCIGKNKEKPEELRVFVSDGKDWDPHELYGFIHAVCKPDFIVDTINNGGKDGG